MSKQKYFPHFDWLRFILAFTVMESHHKLFTWESSGNLAVQVFFALSGWLIAGILLQLKASDLKRFYYNRVLRIWIPYYFALILIIAASLMKDLITSKWFEIVTYKFFYVYNLFGVSQLAEFRQLMPLQGTGSHFWSVNTEEQFYLISPILLVVVSSSIGRSILFWSILSTFLLFIDSCSSISLGVLAAIINKKYPGFYYRNGSKLIFLLTVLISVFAFIYTDYYIYFSPFFAISIVLLLAKEGTQNRFAGFLGGVSYQLYLNHWIGVILANRILKPFIMHDTTYCRILAAVVNILCASLFYVLIDLKIQKYRDRFYSDRLGNFCIWSSYGVVLSGILIGVYFNLFPIKLS